MKILDDILDNIDDGLVIMEPDGKIVLANKVARDLHNLVSNSDLGTGKNIVELVRPERVRVVEGLISEMRKAPRQLRNFAEYETITGARLYLEFHFTPIFDDQESLNYIYLLTRDITPQKAFERNLVTQASNIQNLIEHAPALIIGLDSRGYVTDWNTCCTLATGYSKDEVYAKKFLEKVGVVNRPDFARVFNDSLNGIQTKKFELEILAKSGSSMTLLASITPKASASGIGVGAILAAQDVSELVAYRQVLEAQIETRTRELNLALKNERQALEIKSRFVAVASHEFRSPLASIRHMAGYLQENYDKVGHIDAKEKLKNILKLTDQMTYLLEDILTYGKNMQSVKIRLVLTELSLSEFLNRMVEEVALSTKNSHQVNLECKDLPKLWRTDEKLLRSILINLITNAIKFSPERSFVSVSAACIGSQIIFNVTDYGIGVSLEDQAKIFEPFVRSERVEKIQGTGLGLSIVQKAVELLHGTVEVSSELNKGSTFTVRLPIIQHE